MKNLTLIIVVLGIVFGLASPGAAFAAAQPGDALLGKWWFPKKNGKMEIYRESGKFFGKVIAYDDADALDEHNPDPELAKRPFVGIIMLKDFSYDAGEKQWIDGKIYDGDSGKTYSCKMWLNEKDANKLHARGFVGLAILGRTEIFTRVTAEDEKREAEEAAKKKDMPDAPAEGEKKDEGK